MFKKKRVYFDHASTTPLDPRVLKAMKPFFMERFENPSSLYSEGVKAGAALAEARASIAGRLGALPDEIIFTASGTEADNLALLGIFESARFRKEKDSIAGRPHIIVSAIEHPAVLRVCQAIQLRGGSVTYIPVDEKGIVNPSHVRDALRPETSLVSIMYANNEIGVVQPIREIAKAIRQKAKTMTFLYGPKPIFHTDASQAPLFLDCNVTRLGVDAMTLDASKIYGPKGIGLLYVRRNTTLEPIMYGGGQERGMRPGTENVPAIVGFARALELSESLRQKESARLTTLRDYVIEKILAEFPSASLNGDQKNRLPNNINICFPGADAEFLVLKLDAQGIACSSVTSCRTTAEDSFSYVVEALGKKGCRASSLRFTLGRDTTKKEISIVLAVLRHILPRTS